MCVCVVGKDVCVCVVGKDVCVCVCVWEGCVCVCVCVCVWLGRMCVCMCMLGKGEIYRRSDSCLLFLSYWLNYKQAGHADQVITHTP